LPSVSIFCYIFPVCTNVNMNISTGNSSHRTLARPETFGCHIGTKQNILPDFMYELDKRLASASMFVRLLFFPSLGMPIGNPVIMSITDSRSSNYPHPGPMAVLRSHNMLCEYTSTSNLTWWMQTNPVIMSIADSRSSNSSHPRPMTVLRSHNMLCKYASTSNLTWWMQTRPSGNVLALGAYRISEPTCTFFHPACLTTGPFLLRSVYQFMSLSWHKGFK
jgi:hypothetical protein